MTKGTISEEEEQVFIANSNGMVWMNRKHPYTPDYSGTKIVLHSIRLGCVRTSFLIQAKNTSFNFVVGLISYWWVGVNVKFDKRWIQGL